MFGDPFSVFPDPPADSVRHRLEEIERRVGSLWLNTPEDWPNEAMNLMIEYRQLLKADAERLGIQCQFPFPETEHGYGCSCERCDPPSQLG